MRLAMTEKGRLKDSSFSPRRLDRNRMPPVQSRARVNPSSTGAAQMTASKGSRAYKAGIAVAIVTSLLIVWTTIVRDDGAGMNFFLVILAAIVGGFAAHFQAAGLARTMLGVAIMQVLLAIAIVTAPITASVPNGVLSAAVSGAVFAALWLIAAGFFRAAAKSV
jgi:hypothetical protein